MPTGRADCDAMSCGTDDCDHDWHYADPRTLAGALQHGLGRGAREALDDPTAPELVTDCLRRDYRWEWHVDEREVYLARLVRDLRLPISPITARLYAAAPEDSDDDNEFANTLGVLTVLGRAGVAQVVEDVRGYIEDGTRWVEALELVAQSWPVDWWEDLHPTVADRLDATIVDQMRRRAGPWAAWAARDSRIAAALDASQRRPEARRPFADTSATALLELLRDPDQDKNWRAAVRELRHRPPEPALLDTVDALLAAEVGHPLAAAVARLGSLALPAARSWADSPRHPLFWTAMRILAAHGGPADAPTLVAGLDWLDGRPADLCGYDCLWKGLARVGGPHATAEVSRLRRLWFSPHSYERAGYLKARMAVDPDGVARWLFEGLWDCESAVRLLAAKKVDLDDRVRDRLCYLRDDPIEVEEVRNTAAARLRRDRVRGR